MVLIASDLAVLWPLKIDPRGYICGMILSNSLNVAMVDSCLVVDDDQEILEELSVGLMRYGINVSAASNAVDAIDLFRRNPGIEVAVIDAGMPNIDGFELFKKIQSLVPDRIVPSIMLTGSATLDRSLHAMRVGYMDFLIKPASTLEILAAINGVVRRARLFESASASVVLEKNPITVLSISLDIEKKLKALGIRRECAYILMALKVDSGLPQMIKELAHSVEMPLASVSRYVDSLASHSLVDVQKDPADRRRTHVRITEEGAKVLLSGSKE